MATVSANELSLEKTLEELITEFNSLRGDVSSVTLETLLTSTSGVLTFEGATADAYETSLVVEDPTADRTITLPNVTGTIITTANADAGATTTTIGDLDYLLIDDGGTLKKMSLNSVATNLPTISPPSSDGSALGTATLEWADLYLADGSVIYFGDDQDVTLTHNADTSLTLNLMMAATTFEPTGDTASSDNAAIGYTSAEGLILTGQGSTSDITFKNDADTTVFTIPTGTDDILFADNAKAMWGTSSDLTIYHDGSNSYILDNGTGNLVLAGSQINLMGGVDAAETMATFVDDGAVTLYYNNITALATASGGGTLTGTWEVTTALVPDASDGAALGTTALEWSDLYLADAAVIGFGDDQDVTLTHVADTGLLLNSTMKLQFNDASQFIHGSSATVLDIGATDEIELTATLIDAVGNFTVSGTIVGSDTIQGTTITATTAVVPDASDGAVLGSASLEWSDLYLADAAVIYFGDDQDVTLTHVADTGLLLNSTMAIQFNDASQYINAPSATVLDINATDEVEVNATLMDVNANLDVSGTIVGGGAITGGGLLTTGGNIVIPDDGNIGSATDTNAIAISSGGVVSISATTASTNSTSGALTVAGGAGVAADLGVGDDLRMISDAAVISFGVDSEVTLTHVADTGLLLNGAMQLQFSDASQYINAPSATVLDINATDEIELNATLVDVNANLDVSGTYTGAGLMTTGGNIVIPDAGNIGSASVTNAVAISSAGVVAVAATTASTNSTSGALTVAGGAGIAADLGVGDDLRMISDAAVISFGADSDVTLTHVADTGLLLNSTMKIQFNDASQFIHGSSATVLDIGATDEIELTATLIDVVGNLAVSGNLTIAGTTTIVDTVTMNAQNAVIFEGATADLHETTLTITDPTADRTITLPNLTGTVSLVTATETLTNKTLTSPSFTGDITWTNSDADANSGPVLVMYRNSASPADDDILGEIRFDGENSASQIVEYGSIVGSSYDVTDGEEDGALHMSIMVAGSETNALRLASRAGTASIVQALFSASSSAAVPAISFIGDYDTGMYRVSANQLGFTAAGTHSMTVSSSGVTVAGTIDVSGTTNLDVVDIDGAVNLAATLTLTDAAYFLGSPTHGYRFNSSDDSINAMIVTNAGDVTATTFLATGDTASGDNATIGYTSAEGLILTGQGSTSDITLKNDADGTVFTVPTGTDDILFADNAKAMWGTGSDLKIYHDGSNSYIEDAGTGELKLATSAGTALTLVNGTTNVDVVGDFTAGTLNADGDTAADDNAAIGYTSAEGLILTGQGSTNDVTIKNDADADVIEIPTGTTNVTMAGNLTVSGTVTATAGATLLIKNASGSTLKTIKGMT